VSTLSQYSYGISCFFFPDTIALISEIAELPLQGFDSGNENIDILRLRSYTVGKKLKDDEVLGPGGLNRITELIGIMVPFVSL
jgi:hypothetical protein